MAARVFASGGGAGNGARFETPSRNCRHAAFSSRRQPRPLSAVDPHRSASSVFRLQDPLMRFGRHPQKTPFMLARWTFVRSPDAIWNEADDRAVPGGTRATPNARAYLNTLVCGIAARILSTLSQLTLASRIPMTLRCPNWESASREASVTRVRPRSSRSRRCFIS